MPMEHEIRPENARGLQPAPEFAPVSGSPDAKQRGSQAQACSVAVPPTDLDSLRVNVVMALNEVWLLQAPKKVRHSVDVTDKERLRRIDAKTGRSPNKPTQALARRAERRRAAASRSGERLTYAARHKRLTNCQRIRELFGTRQDSADESHMLQMRRSCQHQRTRSVRMLGEMLVRMVKREGRVLLQPEDDAMQQQTQIRQMGSETPRLCAER